MKTRNFVTVAGTATAARGDAGWLSCLVEIGGQEWVTAIQFKPTLKPEDLEGKFVEVKGRLRHFKIGGTEKLGIAVHQWQVRGGE